MGRTALVFGQLFQVVRYCTVLILLVFFSKKHYLKNAIQVFGVKAAERPLVRNVTFYVMSSNDEAGLAAGQYWTSLSVGVGAIHTYIIYITCITHKPHSHCMR
jgi:hypothetical protein